MNHTQQNQPMMGDQTFLSEPAASNPFTGDIQGEFSSNFGTNTHAVSQIFGSNGYGGGNSSKNIFIIFGGVVLLAVLFIAYKALMKDDTNVANDNIFTPTHKVRPTEAPAAATPEVQRQQAEPIQQEVVQSQAIEDPAVEQAQMVAPEPIQVQQAPQVVYTQPVQQNDFSVMAQPASLVLPANGQSFSYDETQGPVRLNYSSGGSPVRVVLSRNPSMSPVVLAVSSRGSSYGFHQASPGTWYWRVDDSTGGSTQVRSFVVSNPVRRNISVTNPGTINNGDSFNWGGDSQVTSYRLEIVPQGSNWANPYRFASGSTAATITGVPSGDYSMRVGAHSRVSGRWEYTSVGTVSLQ